MQQASWYIGKLSDNRFTRPIKRHFMRLVAAKTRPRSLLNQYYSLLDDEARSRFHDRYAGIFRNDGVSFTAGEWLIQFADQKIRLPLRPSMVWLDWALALGVLGHDIEINKTYAALVNQINVPLFSWTLEQTMEPIRFFFYRSAYQ